MKNMNMKRIALITAILMIATLLVPTCFAEFETPVVDMDKSEDITLTAPDASGEDASSDEAAEDGAAEDDAAEDDAAEDDAAADDATEFDVPKMIFEPTNFVDNLYYMGLGMLGIFVVIGVIIIATALLNKAFQDKKKDE